MWPATAAAAAATHSSPSSASLTTAAAGHHHPTTTSSSTLPVLPADRIGIFFAFKYARGLAFAVMTAAYLVQQATDEESPLNLWVMGLSEQSVLVLVYALIVKLLVCNGLKNWLTQIQDSTSSAVTRVSSSTTMLLHRSNPSLSSSSSSMHLLSLSGGAGGTQQLRPTTVIHRSMSISDQEPFFPVDEIAQMTLCDILHVFCYAAEIGRPSSSFDRRAFLAATKKVSHRCQQAMEAMDEVTRMSRGGGSSRTQACTPSASASSSSKTTTTRCSDKKAMDALYFAAAVRLFAEWRTVRLVPDGTSARYSLGMNMARRDLVQNVRKLEAAAHDWMTFQEKTAVMECNNHGGPAAAGVVESPTLRQLLQHEVQQKVHHALPRVHDKSGASGLLWILRQLQYQNVAFANLAQVPQAFPDGKSAVIAAYKVTYENFHGFIVRRIFQTSFDAAPHAHTILEYMRLPAKTTTTDKDDDEDLTDFDGNDSWSQFPIETVEQFCNQGTEQGNTNMMEKNPNPFEQLGNHIKNEFSKLADFLGQCTGRDKRKGPHHSSRNILHIEQVNKRGKMSRTKRSGQAAAVVREDDLSAFVSHMKVLLDDLNQLICEFNMNDPSKV